MECCGILADATLWQGPAESPLRDPAPGAPHTGETEDRLNTVGIELVGALLEVGGGGPELAQITRGAPMNWESIRAADPASAPALPAPRDSVPPRTALPYAGIGGCEPRVDLQHRAEREDTVETGTPRNTARHR